MDFSEMLRRRTFAFAKGVVLFCRNLPRDEEGRVFRYQLVKAGTSVGANYRASCRGRSDKEKQSKLGVTLEEADECGYWLELLQAVSVGDPKERAALLEESREFIRIFAASLATHKDRQRKKR